MQCNLLYHTPSAIVVRAEHVDHPGNRSHESRRVEEKGGNVASWRHLELGVAGRMEVADSVEHGQL